ncbi:hypothetical protein SAMN02910435_02041 [Ruminococcaceae bacterium D5]|nr:hypothetical protein SAMN02910435_02041 [Ruminococcaceae bacterium D5]
MIASLVSACPSGGPFFVCITFSIDTIFEFFISIILRANFVNV